MAPTALCNVCCGSGRNCTGVEANGDVAVANGGIRLLHCEEAGGAARGEDRVPRVQLDRLREEGYL